MTEEQLRILQAQMIDLNSRVKKLGMFNKILETVKSKQYETFIVFVLIACIGYATYHIEKHITFSSIKNANSIKKELRVRYDSITPSRL